MQSECGSVCDQEILVFIPFVSIALADPTRDIGGWSDTLAKLRRFPLYTSVNLT